MAFKVTAHQLVIKHVKISDSEKEKLLKMNIKYHIQIILSIIIQYIIMVMLGILDRIQLIEWLMD